MGTMKPDLSRKPARRFARIVLLLLSSAFVLSTTLRVLADARQSQPKTAQPKRVTPLSLIGRAEDADLVLKINEQLAEKWKANQLTPSPRCTDYEFIRRASL